MGTAVWMALVICGGILAALACATIVYEMWRHQRERWEE